MAPAITITGGAQIASAPLFAPLTMHLPAVQWTCLLGGSGVGKSTILRLIAGLPTGADFSGQITASDAGPIAPRIAFMAQDHLLMPWASVLENVMLGARLRGEVADKARALAMLADVGLEAHAEKYPNALSGGQKQRVALARTLMEDRPIVLLDEPFSALDAGTRAKMQDLAAKLLAGKTVLLVTHDPAEAARLGDQVLTLASEGLTQSVVPSGAIPRDEGADDVLALQARLLKDMKERAS